MPSRKALSSLLAVLFCAALITGFQHSVQAGSAGVTTVGLGGWQVNSSATATQSGSAISTPGFSTVGWLGVTPDDAGAPGTELEALVQNNACPSVFFSANMKSCFGYMSKIGPDSIAKFSVPWWFRTDFTPNLSAGQNAKLVINGVVGQADVWVNGTQVATQSTVQGAYTRYTFDITSLVRSGTNSLAIEVYPNDPTKMFTLDNVDWSQIPPDNNTGIQFPVQLQISPALAVTNVHVVENNAADLSSSALTVKGDVTNTSGSSQTDTVTAVITPPGGGTPITLQQPVTVPAGQTTTVSLPTTINSPQVWWPYQMGAQPLYTLAMSVGGYSAPQTTFAIRTVTKALVGKSTMAPSGMMQYSINGKPFLVRGGGWSEHLFLHYSAADTAAQIGLIKNMGLNLIRTEGKEMPDDFYQQMDRAGIMINAGFQCCDAWEPSGSLSAQQQAVVQLSALTIGQRLRNHPSVISYQWSDNAPPADEESPALTGFQQADFQAPIIASAEYNSTPTLGPAGQKEGPYDWVPPAYFYDTTHYPSSDSTLTNAGGSWGYDSEQSAGDTVPTMDSINRFMSTADQNNLWQSPKYNQYHTNYEPKTSGYAFGTLYSLDKAITARYGSWSSLSQYVQKAQVQNYETARAQFEAFIEHSTNSPTPATGTTYWQLNKGWPTLLWALYNNDYDQAGAFFGAKKANEGLHVLYAPDRNRVTVDNLGAAAQSGLTVESKVRNLAGTVTDSQTSGTLSLSSQQVQNGVITPTGPTSGGAYFLELTLKQNGTTVDRNVYWLSTKGDIVNWTSSLGNPRGVMSQYADLTALQNLPSTTVGVSSTTSAPDANGNVTTSVTLTNTSSNVGFFLRADIRRGNPDGTEQPGDNQVLPIGWNDNDVTLWPGESQTLTATYRAAQLNGATPVVSLFGWNVARTVVKG